MTVTEQNVKGSAQYDMMGFMDKLDWMMPGGFYYKTMHKPAKIWPLAMKQIRKAAGLGTLTPDFEMKGKYDEIFPKADVCVIGGGPAGMSAALAAQVENSPNIRAFIHTSMIGAYNNNLITGFQVGRDTDAFDERYLEIRAQSVVVATGCIERPLLCD